MVQPRRRTVYRLRYSLGTVVVIASVAAWGGRHGYAQASKTVRDGVFTEAQASRGQALFGQQCSSCHGASLEGAQGPPLAGDVFLEHWQGQPLSGLVDKILNTMPADGPGALTRAQSTDLVAHIIRTGGYPAGRAELASDEAALKTISWPQGLVASASAGSGQVKAYPPLGNMAQLMRGIFFPNSNLIFTVQTHDPSEKPAPSTAGQNAGFSWVDWGQGIYGGWELVDNAAIALADASPLMLAPGIRCENGRLAPVTDPDWIKFTENMIAVARKTYQASQSRSQDAVSEATGDLADACAACHSAYRDIRQRGRAPDPTDPSNKAARCMARSSTPR